MNGLMTIENIKPSLRIRYSTSKEEDNIGITKLLKMLKLLDSKLPPNMVNAKVQNPEDSCATDVTFDDAIWKETVGLIQKKAFPVVIREEIDR